MQESPQNIFSLGNSFQNSSFHLPNANLLVSASKSEIHQRKIVLSLFLFCFLFFQGESHQCKTHLFWLDWYECYWWKVKRLGEQNVVEEYLVLVAKNILLLASRTVLLTKHECSLKINQWDRSQENQAPVKWILIMYLLINIWCFIYACKKMGCFIWILSNLAQKIILDISSSMMILFFHFIVKQLHRFVLVMICVYTSWYTNLQWVRDRFNIMVIVIGNGNCNLSSNLEETVCVLFHVNALRKAWIHLFSPRLWVNSRTDCFFFSFGKVTNQWEGKL